MKKIESDKRTIFFKVRMNSSELEELKKLKGRSTERSVSNYARKVLLQKPITIRLLNTEPEIQVLMNPFITAFQNDAMKQLEGQVASAKIVLSRLASPQLYWVLSGNDFTLDIHNPKKPKLVCMGNNPGKQQIYGAVLSLYISRLIRIVNKKDQHPCRLVFDEFPTIFF